MTRRIQPALQSILDAIAGIEEALRGKSFAEYEESWLLRHGVQRGIEIISEASRRIPEALRDTRPEIPWQQVMGIGNVLRHEYHDISDRVIWNVVQQHLPPLKAAVEALSRGLQE